MVFFLGGGGGGGGGGGFGKRVSFGMHVSKTPWSQKNKEWADWLCLTIFTHTVILIHNF